MWVPVPRVAVVLSDEASVKVTVPDCVSQRVEVVLLVVMLARERSMVASEVVRESVGAERSRRPGVAWR